MHSTLLQPCEEELAFLILASGATWIWKIVFIFSAILKKAALYQKSSKLFAHYCVYFSTTGYVLSFILPLVWSRKFLKYNFCISWDMKITVAVKKTTVPPISCSVVLVQQFISSLSLVLVLDGKSVIVRNFGVVCIGNHTYLSTIIP